MTNTSVTLAETGIADAINDGGGRWESARNKRLALDFATQAQEMRAIGGQPDYVLGSGPAVTAGGTLVIASASGSQLASYAWGAAKVIFVVGAQKLVPTLAAAHERIYQHSLLLEDARAQAAYGQHSQVGKILEIHQELPGLAVLPVGGLRAGVFQRQAVLIDPLVRRCQCGHELLRADNKDHIGRTPGVGGKLTARRRSDHHGAVAGDRVHAAQRIVG